MHYPADHILGAQRNGVNLTLMENAFDSSTGPVSGTNYPVFSTALLDFLANKKKMRSVRLLFSWEALQTQLLIETPPTPSGGIPPQGPTPAATANHKQFWDDFLNAIRGCLTRGMYVIIAPLQHGPSGDTDITYNKAAFSKAQFADFWGTLAAALKSGLDPGMGVVDPRVGFDLINEPHTKAEAGNAAGVVGISLHDWFDYALAAIAAIRGAGVTNTIFVPGMAYTAASSFTTNGSSARWATPAWQALTQSDKNIAVTVHLYSGIVKPPGGTTSVKAADILRSSCAQLVSWARGRGVKVHIGEIALDAGNNGLDHCTDPIDIAGRAAAQWEDWRAFCAENSDVIIGWNWWAVSSAGWWDLADSCGSGSSRHWGLTVDDGKTQSIYMTLIESSVATPFLAIADDPADTGSGPNPNFHAWESPDIVVDPTIIGGASTVVGVRVTNRGQGATLAGGKDVVRLYWAKAAAGLGWPAPWTGGTPSVGGPVAVEQPVGVLAAGASRVVPFTWPTTPDPADHGGDPHFCLLAVVTKAQSDTFDGFAGALNDNVRRFSNVAQRNIHITSVQPFIGGGMGRLVLVNPFDERLRVTVGFEVLDAVGRIVVQPPVSLLITPTGLALEVLRRNADALRGLEDRRDGSYRLLDPAEGFPELELEAGDRLPFETALIPEGRGEAVAVRAIQYAVTDGARKVVGGQTFVAGEVEGLSSPQPEKRPSATA